MNEQEKKRRGAETQRDLEKRPKTRMAKISRFGKDSDYEGFYIYKDNGHGCTVMEAAMNHKKGMFVIDVTRKYVEQRKTSGFTSKDGMSIFLTRKDAQRIHKKLGELLKKNISVSPRLGGESPDSP